MNRLMMRYPLMDEPLAPSGEGGGAGGEAKAEPQPTEPTATGEPENLLDGEDQPDAGGEPPPTQTNEPKNLLDDDPQPNGQQPTEAKGPTEEEIKAWTEGIKATDLGEGVRWDDAALTAITPELMQLSGNDPKKAEGLIKAYTKHQQAQLKAFQESQDRFNTELIAQCKAKFGDDLKKIAGYARIGGREVFGDKLWNEMKKVPQFANNPDILERLAMVGRRTATDGGKVTPKAGEPEAEGDVLHRMYGNVKV